ncbi:MAG: rhomboid family intramembrane serine protease [Prolixibacteraceae bacterium]|jgi:membrane associated rhomboid family serine protease|nr:rhomboid family intramembrane serine protease [Prolixibacteraceae bacterium]
MSKFTFRYYPQPLSPEQIEMEKKIFKYSLFVPIIFLMIIWLIKLAEITFDTSFHELGMYPRKLKGLAGILFSPLLHGSFKHLIGNSSTFIVLGTALFFFYRNLAMRIFLLNYFMSGIFLWLGGREVWHIGASGIIYGLTAFLFLSGILRNDVRLLTISLIVTFLYGSFFWGLFPTEEGISWDGHLMGALSGTMLALVYYRQGPPRKQYEWENDEEDDEMENNSDYQIITNENSIENSKEHKDQSNSSSEKIDIFKLD